MAGIDDLELQNELLSEQLETNRINADVIKEQVSLAKQLSDIAKLSSEQALKINKANRDLTSLSKQLVDQASEREKLMRSERDITRDIKKSLDIQKSLDTEILQIQEKSVLSSGRERDLLIDIISGLEDQKRLNEDNSKSLGQELQLSQKINSSFGIGGVLLKGWSGLLDKIGIDTGNIAQQTRDQLSDLEREGKLRDGASGKLQGLGVIGKNVGKALMNAFNEPLVSGGFLLKQFIDAFTSIDDLAGETAKNFGTSYDNAVDLNSKLTAISSTNHEIFLTTKNLVEAQNQLSTSLGTNTSLSGNMLINYTELTKQAGYSVEAATTLSRLSIITKKDSKDLAATYLGQVKSLNLKNNLAINEKALLNDISNTSKGLLATYSSQPGKLAEAAFEAKKLGSSIKEIEGISQSLLDIESSISNEFEAEVMTGKQLNLEKARYFALTNDIAGVAKEINKQGIDLNTWSGMNVLQQESIAKSMGMSKDQMAGMLLESSALSKLGSIDGKNAQEKFENLVKQVGLEEARKRIGDEMLTDQLNSVSNQEKFNQSIEKLKELFVSLATPLMPIMTLFGNIASLVGYIVTPFGELMNLANKLGPILGGIVSLLTAAGIAAFFLTSSLTAGIAGAVILAGLGFAITKIREATSPQPVQDGIADASRGPFTVTDKYGATAITTEGDGLAVSPNINVNPSQKPITSQPISSEGGITILASTLGNKMDVMIHKLDTLVGVMSKGMVVNLDGNRVSQELGTPMAIANRRI